jgi:hypothetical protein
MLCRQMLDSKNILLGCFAFLREHPEEILRAAREASHLRFGVPVVALRWLATQFDGVGGPRDVQLEPVPPGIRVTATVEEMGTLLRASAVLIVDNVNTSAGELRVEVRLSDVSIRLLDNQAKTPLAALIVSGALDVSRIANLVAHMPTRPSVLVEAIDNRLVLDFMRIPALARDERMRQLVGVLSSLLCVKAITTDTAHVDVALKLLPKGFDAFFRSR